MIGQVTFEVDQSELLLIFRPKNLFLNIAPCFILHQNFLILNYNLNFNPLSKLKRVRPSQFVCKRERRPAEKTQWRRY